MCPHVRCALRSRRSAECSTLGAAPLGSGVGVSVIAPRGCQSRGKRRRVGRHLGIVALLVALAASLVVAPGAAATDGHPAAAMRRGVARQWSAMSCNPARHRLRAAVPVRRVHAARSCVAHRRAPLGVGRRLAEGDARPAPGRGGAVAHLRRPRRLLRSRSGALRDRRAVRRGDAARRRRRRPRGVRPQLRRARPDPRRPRRAGAHARSRRDGHPRVAGREVRLGAPLRGGAHVRPAPPGRQRRAASGVVPACDRRHRGSALGGVPPAPPRRRGSPRHRRDRRGGDHWVHRPLARGRDGRSADADCPGAPTTTP